MLSPLCFYMFCKFSFPLYFLVFHIIKKITGSKGKKTMKLGRLIEYNMRNVFLEESFTKCGGETIPRTFFKKSKLNISLGR